MNTKVTADTSLYGAFPDNMSITHLTVRDNATITDLYTNRLFLTPVAQPACDATTLGMFWYSGHSVGVKDDVQVCTADAANAYAWRVLY